MSLRRLLFWIHLTCGVAAGGVILIMSVTGVLLTYQRQITAWSDMRAYRAGPPSPAAARLSVDALVSKVGDTMSGPIAMTVTLRSDPTAPASVTLGQRALFVNSYTGEVLGEGAPGVRAFFRRVTDWHRWLGASDENRAAARMMTGASNLAFFIIVVSGPFLWWPRKFGWAHLRSIVWFKGGLSSRARDFNWHNTIGLWSALPLMVIVWSGVVISYPWATNLVYRLAGEQPLSPRSGPAGPGERRRSEEPDSHPDAGASGRVALDVLIARAAERHPAWRTIAMRLPVPPRGPLAVTVDEGDGGQPQKRGTITFDRTTGRVINWESQAGSTSGRRARSWLRFAHTGEVYGVAGQTVAGISSLGGALLVWTGLALAVRRVLNARLWKSLAAGKGLPPAGQPSAPSTLSISMRGLSGQERDSS
jgi:uncharacterized iron-regulated membrane protein